MKKPYFLSVAAVYDDKQTYPETQGAKLFTPASRYFFAHKKPGETITVEVEVEDWDTNVYAASSDVDIYCGESYGRA